MPNINTMHPHKIILSAVDAILTFFLTNFSLQEFEMPKNVLSLFEIVSSPVLNIDNAIEWYSHHQGLETVWKALTNAMSLSVFVSVFGFDFSLFSTEEL